jgi:hypothetical protein
MNQRRHHRPAAPKSIPDPDKPCMSCVHHVQSDTLIPVVSCCLNPTQPQLVSFQRSVRGVCGPSGQYYKLPKVLNIWGKIKAFFRIKP